MMLKIAIIGCGKISDQHADHIKYISDARLVGVCDRDELMASQMAERYKAEFYFTDFDDLITKAKPDVVHITTPPASHYSLARKCLQKGIHVYIEKPFTIDYSEAVELIKFAEHSRAKLTVGHNVQFTFVANRMRQIMKNGHLGGTPFHIESYYNYDLTDVNYAKVLLSDNKHWVRSLPGKLLQNIISHGIAKIAEFMEDNHPEVIAIGHGSNILKAIQEYEIIDELRVLIKDRKNEMTANFIFSSQIKPVLHQLRIYGPNRSLSVDDDNQTLILFNPKSHKSYLNQFIPPIVMAKQYMYNSFRNLYAFIKRDIYQDSGMRCLIRKFYLSILNNTQVPIPYHEILRTTYIMDKIFQQLK
jgi:predicted dehydrogenase